MTTRSKTQKSRAQARKARSHKVREHNVSTIKARRYWSARVTETSNALDLEPSVFRKERALEIAQSLKRSAERSRRRKSSSYQSAMSMLTFYINRAGRNLPAKRLRVLERAKGELRRIFGRT